MVRAELAMAIILPDTGEGKERNSAEKSPAGLRTRMRVFSLGCVVLLSATENSSPVCDLRLTADFRKSPQLEAMQSQSGRG
jgi:hypothetical protein